MKRFLKILLWIIVAFVVLSAGLFLFVQTNSKTVVSELKKQLNKYLLTEVQINDIDISSLKHFPNITVILDKVVVKEVPKESGLNLAELDKVYLVINLIDFLRKDYIIQKAVCNNGKINIKRYLDKSWNYDVWKTTSSDTSASDVEFQIDKAIFQDIELYYIDYPYNYYFKTLVDKCDLKGKLTESPYKIQVHSKSRNLSLKVHQRNFTKDEVVEIQTVLDYDSDNEIFQLHQTKLWIDENKIEVDGSYIYNFKNSQSRMDLVLKAKSLNYKTVFDYLPNSYKLKLKDFNIKGGISFKATVKGVYDSKRFPAIDIDFQTNNTDLNDQAANLFIENIKLSGTFSNKGSGNLSAYFLSIPGFSAKIDNNDVSGSFVLQDFNNPYININFKSKISSKSLNTFVKKQNILFDSGSVDIDFAFKGKVAGLKNISEHEQINAKFILEGISAKDQTGNKIDHLNGILQVKENQVFVDNLSANFNNINFKFSGNLEGLIPYIVSNISKIKVKGNLDIDKINLNTQGDNKVKKQQSFKIPDLRAFDIELNTRVDELLSPGFSASQVNGIIKVKDNSIIAKNLNFKTSSGNISLSGMIRKTGSNEITFEGKSVLSKIDLTKLFIEFNNFGQNNLTDKHLRGTVDADIDMIVSFDSNFNWIESGLYAMADITISNGELINYKTIQNLLGFIKLKKMDHLKFDKMQNTIIIKDRRIDIPKMTLNSSAFNMDIQGWHTFDNQIEYNMKINLTQLFFGKNKVDKAQFENGEDDTKGGINMYVTMYGTVSDPQFRFNKSSVKTKAKESIGNQKKEMKEILQKKKDEKSGKNTQENNNNDFELEWDEN
jgi:hypothetical protein